MKKKIAVIAVFICLGLLPSGLALAEEKSTDAMASGHMVAQAMLTAHFIDAAVKAGMSTDEINAVLAKVADETIISEFWISDEAGRIDYTSHPGTEFVFPTDPEAGSQAAPFARPSDRRRDCRRSGRFAARTGFRAVQIRWRRRDRPGPHRADRIVRRRPGIDPGPGGLPGSLGAGRVVACRPSHPR